MTSMGRIALPLLSPVSLHSRLASKEVLVVLVVAPCTITRTRPCQDREITIKGALAVAT